MLAKKTPALRNLSLFSTIMLVFMKHESKLKGKPMFMLLLLFFYYSYGKIKEFLPK